MTCLPIATQAEAEAGTANDKTMTPLRTKEAIGTLAAPAGSSMVGFLQAGTDAVTRTSQAKMRDVVSVKDFLGINTVTSAFQRALATGADVFVPSGSYQLTAALTTTAAGPTIHGEGPNAIIEQGGINANSTCIVLAHEGCRVTGLHLRPNGTTGTQVHGYGVTVTADGCMVDDCVVSQMRRGGVLILNSDNCVVRGNIFKDSVVVVSPTLPQSDTGADVMCLGTSSNNIVEGNQCISGCGVGVAAQTGTTGASQVGNIFRGNRIKGHPCYGIMGYNSDPGDRVDDLVIEGNTIEDISGTIFVNGGANLFYGAGIYIQTVSRFVVVGNNIKRTNTDRSLPRSGSDVPAAIAVSGRTNGAICSNVIKDAFYGIMVSQATNMDSAIKDGLTITGNVIRPDETATRNLKAGIYLIDTVSAVVANNDIAGTTTAGTQHCIYVFKAGSTAMKSFHLVGNRCVTANNGIEFGGTVEKAIVENNITTDNAFYGIYCTATETILRGNIMESGGRGYGLPASVTKAIVKDNMVKTIAGNEAVPAPGAGVAVSSGNRYSVGASEGVASLVGGTVTVNTIEIRTGDRVTLVRQTAGGALGEISLGTITNAASFVINSGNAADTSTVFWRIEH